MKSSEFLSDREEIFQKSKYFLVGHYKKSLSEILLSLTKNFNPDTKADFYGTKKLIEDFEKKIAQFLGFPAAVFMPSGTMAQTIALRIWSDRKNLKTIGFHPKSHLEIHEHKAYNSLHGLQSILLGHPEKLLELKDLESCPPLSALLLELPQRDLGGILPSWDELKKFSAWAKNKNTALHMDGARLWESQPYYKKSFTEITSLFDSVYVSFYKGLGGIAGAILAGDAELIKEAKIWQRRHGGNLITLFPYILSADLNFDLRINQMELYHQKAMEVAALLSKYKNVSLTPNPPHTNMMHLYIQAPLDKLNEASLKTAQDTNFYLFHAFKHKQNSPESLPMTEITIGECALNLSNDFIEKNLKVFFNYLHS
jgi:threonine aldolase